MTEERSRPSLTPDQVLLLYERQVNHASLYVLLTGLAAIAAGLALYWLLPVEAWVRMVAAVVVIVGVGGMVQRLWVLRVRCPVCGARVLGRIHSILQVRSVTRCPRCEAGLRR